MVNWILVHDCPGGLESVLVQLEAEKQLTLIVRESDEYEREYPLPDFILRDLSSHFPSVYVSMWPVETYSLDA